MTDGLRLNDRSVCVDGVDEMALPVTTNDGEFSVNDIERDRVFKTESDNDQEDREIVCSIVAVGLTVPVLLGQSITSLVLELVAIFAGVCE